MIIKKIEYPSSNNIDMIFAKIYRDKNIKEYKGVIQVVHGMWEHTDRYYDFAEYYTKNGYIVAVHDHLGHGYTPSDDSIYGHFGDNDGNKYVVKDVYNFYTIIKTLYPSLPHFIYAHSMGGLITVNVLYVYKLDIDGLILLGSHMNNASNYLFYPLVKTGLKFFEPSRPAKFFTYMQGIIFSLRFLTSKDGKRWTNRDSDYFNGKDFNDPEMFYFTFKAYEDIFKLSFNATPKNLARNLDKDLPILLMTGSHDPVTSYSKLTRQKNDYLTKNGFNEVSLYTYNKARHNLIMELNRDEVLADMLYFFDMVVKKAK